MLLYAALLLCCIASSYEHRSLSGGQVDKMIRRRATGIHYIIRQLVTWHDAWEKCHNQGTHLAVVNSPGEAKVLQYMMQEYPGQKYFHIGSHNFYTVGKFRSIFGLSLKKSGYEKWAPGKPTALANEFCMALDINGTLNNFGCGLLYYPICESYV